MSAVAVRQGSSDDGVFRPVTVVLMVVIGVAAFAAMLVLGAYSPDLKSGKDGGTHALSNAATGFSGLYRLAEATGRNPRIARSVQLLDIPELVVLSPPLGTVSVTEHTAVRSERPTLLILPKWETKPDPKQKGWVRYVRVHPHYVPEGVLAPATRLKIAVTRSGNAPLVSNVELYDAKLNQPIRFIAPRPLQTVSGAGLRPMIADRAGRIVLGELGNDHFYVLADPDLLSNRGIRDPKQAQAALALLDFLNVADAKSVTFDVALNGLGHSPSPLKLAFEPPFLAMTIAIAVALLLAGLHALGRFGPPEKRARAIAFGKAALIDNTAALVRKARREGMLGARYAQVIRERASIAFGVPAKLRGTAAGDAYLDKVARRGSFTALAKQAQHQDTAAGALAAAQALHDWQEEIG